MSVARKIFDFPWVELNLMDRYQYFANVSFKNNFENSVIIIRKIYYDTDKDCLTLPKFKNMVAKQLEYSNRLKLKTELKPIELYLKSFSDVINELRNERFAHKIDPSISGRPKEYNLNLKQLEDIVGRLNNYFSAIYSIAFNIEYESLPMEYNTQYNKGNSDIEQVLEKIGLESDRLRLKEERPEVWDTFIQRWTMNGKLKKHLNAINYFRKKANLIEIVV